jgi:methionyl-tRNA formyltransferase
MNIVFITVNAPMYLPDFLDSVFTRLSAGGHRICGVTVLPASAGGKLFREIGTRLAYYGPFDFLRMSALIMRNILSGRTVDAVCRRHRVPFLPTVQVNDQAYMASLRKLETELVISVASPQIFRRALLEIPRHGCLNVHMAKLPAYRGREPLFWALLNGEPEVAATIHEIDEKLDNGPIVVQKTVPVASDDSLHSLFQKACRAGQDALIEAVEGIARGSVQRLPNDATHATCYRFPDRAAARRFRAHGLRFF